MKVARPPGTGLQMCRAQRVNWAVMNWGGTFPVSRGAAASDQERVGPQSARRDRLQDQREWMRPPRGKGTAARV